MTEAESPHAYPATGQRLLDDVRVVEIADPLTEYAGAILAGLGAEVWLVEAPEGGATRRRAPFATNASPSRRSIPFLARNRGKRSVIVDRARPADHVMLADLMKKADVILEPDGSPFRQAAEESGAPIVRVCDPDHLGASAIVGFAASGGLSSSGWPHQPPTCSPSWMALDTVGTFAAAAALLMVRTRRIGGNPSVCEVPYTEAAIAGLTGWTRTLCSYGMTAAGQGADAARLGSGPFPVLPCLDGYIRVIPNTLKQWRGYVEMLGSPEPLEREEWESRQFRNENYDAAFLVACEITRTRTVDEWFRAGQALGVPVTPVLDVKGVLDDPHVGARRLFIETIDPDLGPVRTLRVPVRTDDPRNDFEVTPAPTLGEHSAAVGLVPSPARRPQRSGDAAIPTAPLRGLRVLSFGVGAVVPEMASFLALLGAEAIKIESRAGLDFFRGSQDVGDVNSGPTFNQANLGVKSCAINMATEEGRAIARDLIAKADVVMENMRATVMKKWDLGYEAVRSINPRAIYVSSQGLGEGPYGGYTTYGPHLQSFAGMNSLWAHPDDPYPVGSCLSYPDHVAGRQALSALFAALLRRDRDGQGCLLDCAQFEVVAWQIADKFLEYQVLGACPAPIGNQSLDFAPHACYPCKGHDTWCALAVTSDEEWKAFAAALGQPWTQESRFSTDLKRRENRADLDRLIALWTRTMEPAEVESHLRAHGVCASQVADGVSQSRNLAMHVSGFYTAMSHPVVGLHWYTGLPLVLDGKRIPLRRAPLLGEHSEEVVFDILGLEPEVVSDLMARQIIGY